MSAHIYELEPARDERHHELITLELVARASGQIDFGSEPIQQAEKTPTQGLWSLLPLLSRLPLSDRATAEEMRKELQRTMDAAHELFRTALHSTDFQRLKVKVEPIEEQEEGRSSNPASAMPAAASVTTAGATVANVRTSTVGKENAQEDEAQELYLALMDVSQATHQLQNPSELDQLARVAAQADRNAAMLVAANLTSSAGASVPLVGAVVSILASACVAMCEERVTQHRAAETLLEAIHNLHVWLRASVKVYALDVPFKQQALTVQNFPYVVKFLYESLKLASIQKEWHSITQGIDALLRELDALATQEAAAGVAATRKHLRTMSNHMSQLQADVRLVGQHVAEVSRRDKPLTATVMRIWL